MKWNIKSAILALLLVPALALAGDRDLATKRLSELATYSGTPASGDLLVIYDASDNRVETMDATALEAATVDVGGTADAVILDADGDTTFSAPTDDELDIEVGGDDVIEVNNSTGTHAYLLPGATTHTLLTNVFALWDDFTQQTLTEVDGPWIENSGGDAEALDPAIEATSEGGVVTLVTGDADGACANDCSQIIGHIPVQADSGGLVFETRLHIDSAVTTVSVCAGLTDVTTIEEPATVGGSDAITTNFSNGVVFCYDTGADTDEWFAIGVDGDTDATGNAATGTAPTADTYQVLRIEVDADGETARLYIDGALEVTLTASATAASTNLFPTVVANATTTTSRSVDIDYIYVGHSR